MKVSPITLVALSLTSLLLPLKSQVLIAGWDMSQFEFGAFSENDGDFSFESPNIPASTSDLDDRGTQAIYWDGTNGSSAFLNSGLGQGNGDNVGANFGTATVNQQIPSRQVLENPFFGQHFEERTDASGLSFGNSAVGSLVNGLQFSIVFDTSGASGIVVTMAIAADEGGPTTIDWSYSAGGGPVNLSDDEGDGLSDGISTTPDDQTFRLYTLDLSSISAIEDQPSVRLIGTLGGQSLDVRTITIDNIQVSGFTAESDPSFWSVAPRNAHGWRNTFLAFPGEPGIGWINDVTWPYIYSYEVRNDGGDGQFLFVLDDEATYDAQNFFAYAFDGGFWIYGNNAWGWYFDYSASQWFQFGADR